jgi:hypothetical protein
VGSFQQVPVNLPIMAGPLLRPMQKMLPQNPRCVHCVVLEAPPDLHTSYPVLKHTFFI